MLPNSLVGRRFSRNRGLADLSARLPASPTFWHQGHYRIQQSASVGSLVLIPPTSSGRGELAAHAAFAEMAPQEPDASESTDFDLGYLSLYADDWSASV